MNPPSCEGLDATCGPDRNEPCCESIYVPGGTFNRSNDAEYPATVSDFRLDAYEITVGRFKRFVAAYTQDMITGGSGKNPDNSTDPGWDPAWNASLPADQSFFGTDLQCSTAYETWTADDDSLPVNCITWFEAEAFCIWDGGRLPTEAEWNYAAAGGNEQRTYAWGDTAPGTDALLAVAGCYWNGTGTCNDVTNIAPVGSIPAGNGRWGQADLTGNLWEWVQDAFGAYLNPCTDCADTSDPNTSTVTRRMRGGSYYDAAAQLTTSYRNNDSPVRRYYSFGARCARDNP